MRVRAIYADFFSCVRRRRERQRRVEWPEFEFKRRGRGGNPRERSGGSRLKRRGSRIGRMFALLGPKLLFVAGLVIFVTAVSRLVCLDLLG